MFLRHTKIRTRDPRVSSPSTCPLDQPAAVREGVPPISGHYVPGWATPGRSRALPLCVVVSRARISGRAPLCSGEVGAPSGAGRCGAVVVPDRDLYVASRAGFSCPGSFWSLPTFLASYGEFIAPRMSSEKPYEPRTTHFSVRSVVTIVDRRRHRSPRDFRLLT